MAVEGGGDYRQRLVQRQLQIKKRKQAGLANARADAGPPSSSRMFSSPPKREDTPNTFNRIVDASKSFGQQAATDFALGLTKPVYKLAGAVGAPDEGILGKEQFLRGQAQLFTGFGTLAPEEEFINRVRQDTKEYSGKELASDLLASYANFISGAGTTARLVGAGKRYAGDIAVGALRGIENTVPRARLAAELASGGMTTRIPTGMATRGMGYKPYGAAVSTGSNISRFADEELPAEDVILNEPEWLAGNTPTQTRRGTISEAKELVDTEPIISKEPRARTKGAVPVVISDVTETNELLFGPNVTNTGSVGSSITDDIYQGSQVMVGRRLSPERLAKDMLTVAKRGVRERFKGIKTTGTERPIWAKTTLANFEQDFGEGTARVTNIEGRRSITGPYDDASTIPQTIQHDHTIVSPTDLKAFSDETKELRKSGAISSEELAKRKQVEQDMRTILQDPHNLVPVHRNTNVLLSSFNRERLLSDPDFAASVNITEDTLGDIWAIMSREGSGYRASVQQAYDWARRGRKGKRSDSIDYWQQWQDSRVEDTLARRNQRLMQAGIKLD